MYLFISFSVYSHYGYSQINETIYDTLYPVSDAIKKEGKTGIFSATIYKTLDSLNTLHPKNYFKKATQLVNQAKFNEASLLYYTGLIRYKYYNWCKKSKSINEEEKLLAHYQEIIGDVINMFLRSDVDNFISILHSSATYCKEHDYTYFNKSTNINFYQESYSYYLRMSEGFKTNKTYFKNSWNSERKEFETTNKLEKK